MLVGAAMLLRGPMSASRQVTIASDFGVDFTGWLDSKGGEYRR